MNETTRNGAAAPKKTVQQKRNEKLYQSLQKKHSMSPQEAQEMHQKQQKIIDLKQRLEEDNLREDGFHFRNEKIVASRRYKDSPGMIARTFDGHSGPVYKCVISRDGTRLYTFATNEIRVWEVESTSLVGVLPHDLCDMICGDISPSKSDLIVAKDCEMYFHRKENGLKQTESSTEDVNHVHTSMNPNENNEIPQDRAPVGCLEFDSMEHVQGCSFGHDGSIVNCKFSPNGKLLATCSDDSTVILWTTSTLSVLHVFAAHPYGVTSLCFSPNGQLLITTGGFSKPEIKLWTVKKFQEMTQEKLDEIASLNQKTRTGYQSALQYLFSPSVSMESLMVGSTVKSIIRNDEWYAHGFDHSEGIQVPISDSDGEDQKSEDEYADDEKSICSEKETVELNDLELIETLNPEQVLKGNCVSIQYTKMDPKEYLVRDFEDYNEERVYRAHTDRINASVFSPCGQIVASVGSDRMLKLWDPITGYCIRHNREAHDFGVLDVVFSLDSKLVITCSVDSFLKVWIVESLECRFCLRGHFDTVHSLALDRSGCHVISASADQRVVMWRIVPKEPDTPKQPQICDIECYAMKLTWDAPLGNGSALETYVIEISEEGEPFGKRRVEIEAKHSSRVMNALLPGTLYSFRIAAINGIGQGSFSEPSTGQETLAFRPNALLKPCSIVDHSSDTCFIEWIAPRKNGARIRFYHIHCIAEGAQDEKSRVELKVSTEAIEDQMHMRESTRIENLERKEVARKEKLQVSLQRRSSRVSRATKRAVRSVKLRQQRQARNAVNALGLRGSIKTNTEIIKQHAEPKETLSYVVHGLMPGTVYQFVIAGENRCGVGDFSEKSSYICTAVTAPFAPFAPTVGNAQPYSMDVSWEPPRANGSGIVHYTLEWKQEDVDLSGEVVLSVGSLASNQHTVTGLRAGSEFLCRVSAANFIDGKIHNSPFSPYSSPINTLQDKPSKPRAPMVIDSTSRSIRVSLHTPHDNGLPITMYTMAVFIQETSFGVTTQSFVREIERCALDVQAEANATVQIENLQALTTYLVRVCCTNALGKGEDSDECEPVCTSQASVPARIDKEPDVTDVKPSNATVTWTTPIHNGGANIRYYVVQIYRPELHSYLEPIHWYGADTTVTLDMLKSSTAYQFRVASCNSAGQSEFSSFSRVVTTPSLVEYTIVTYFASRPDTEIRAARKIQARYRKYCIEKAQREAHMAYLSRWAIEWQLL